MALKAIFVPYLDKLSEFVFKIKIPINVGNHKLKTHITSRYINLANKDNHEVLKQFNSSLAGLTSYQAETLMHKYGPNEIIGEKRENPIIRLIKAFYNPLSILLAVLAAISLFTQDITTASIIFTMIALSVFIRFFQENQAYNAAKNLKSMVKTTCTVIRDNNPLEIDLRQVVPGDIIKLAAGDLIPADVRLLVSKDIFLNQSLLTGESLSVEKHVIKPEGKVENIFEIQNLCLMGTNVESGTANGIVIATGRNTYFGSIAETIVGKRVLTSFEKGINRFTLLIIVFMAIMAPLVFMINGLAKGNWLEAFFFSIAVAVGLTPEMLPAIVTVNLSKGAITMSKKKVIVKRLTSIQNFGAINVLCTDKTGTLTQNKIVLIKNINIEGKTDAQVLHYAFLNSYYQTGFKNLLDQAVLQHAKDNNLKFADSGYQKVDELPFDFSRRRMSVVVKDSLGEKLLLCKGAVEETASICIQYELNGVRHPLTQEEVEKIKNLSRELAKDGFRVVAVAYKESENDRTYYNKSDEKDMIFLGFMTFLDPPKESAKLAITHLKQHGIKVKVLTGDNDLVTRKICKEVGLEIEEVLLGREINQLSDAQLREVVEKTTIFAKLLPDDKKRIVGALQENDNVVGFLGDGINDAPGLRTADVGISVDSAVDIAKESADIILLEMSLDVLNDGVIEGRKVFANIIKYIKMGASSNFGNMFSVVGASIFLPFLPMTPLQLLTNNLLYDLSQAAIPTDNVEKEFIEKPRKWQVGDIRRFMLFIGPVSSIFDYVTFGILIFVFHALVNPSLFQTGWFVESILTQTLIVHVIRSSKIPFLQTWASKPLLATTITIMAISIYLPFSPIGKNLGFVKLPILFWPLLILILLSYVVLTQIIKTIYIKKFRLNSI